MTLGAPLGPPRPKKNISQTPDPPPKRPLCYHVRISSRMPIRAKTRSMILDGKPLLRGCRSSLPPPPIWSSPDLDPTPKHIFLHFPTFFYIFLHFPIFFYMFLHFLHFPTFSFHFSTCSYMFLHFPFIFIRVAYIALHVSGLFVFWICLISFL